MATASVASTSALPPMATLPAALTAPDVPGGTIRQVRTDLGAAPTHVPISVATVSAPAAASADAPHSAALPLSSPVVHTMVAASANTPPLAST